MLVTDDGVPKARALVSSARPCRIAGSRQDTATDSSAAPGADSAVRRNRTMLPPSRSTVGKNVGLHLSWFVYRGSGHGDIRSGTDQVVGRHANGREFPVGADLVSAGDAEGRQGRGPATFSEPGTYMLRGLADDGALTGFDDVVVTVSGGDIDVASELGEIE